MATSALHLFELLEKVYELVSQLATGQHTHLDSSFGEKASYAVVCIGVLNDRLTKIRDILSRLLSAYGNLQPLGAVPGFRIVCDVARSCGCSLFFHWTDE
ncbi:hypothetical protein GQ42DRAFT_66293 [Ramicandelaber brevisporus]|nr:hypothetical protein GQ42DRAFT_66293 [Ramicandelaber brevisporus]